ncbi:glyoxalase [Rhizocola hellebori]|uniref:Glyoxalase n=1 Tax=Rhizocola hellebori TaxID=1392758 RepID=A0A8J3VIU0_9ACTN|nr:VOC family protein [Rhizocola hellebori]GIH08754.1 glyoxalase [Rhizocola hellebori]
MTRLSHLFVHVSDLDRAKRFYVDDLGLAILMEETGYLRVGGADGFHMGLEQREPSQVGSVGIEIVIQVPDVDAAYQKLVERGHQFEAPPTDMPWGARHAWLKDPDGYPLSIYS